MMIRVRLTKETEASKNVVAKVVEKTPQHKIHFVLDKRWRGKREVYSDEVRKQLERLVRWSPTHPNAINIVMFLNLFTTLKDRKAVAEIACAIAVTSREQLTIEQFRHKFDTMLEYYGFFSSPNDTK